MNPYERRIIHAAVSEIEGVTSQSKGEEPWRKVIISSTTPRKYDNRGGYKKNGGRRRNNNNRRSKGLTSQQALKRTTRSQSQRTQ